MKFKKVTHVIFDMDGLLLDTESLYTQAISNLTSKYGKEYTFEHKLAMMGSTAPAAAEYLIKALDLPITTQEYIDTLAEQYKLLMTNPSLMPDDQLVYELIARNIAKYDQNAELNRNIERIQKKTDRKFKTVQDLEAEVLEQTLHLKVTGYRASMKRKIVLKDVGLNLTVGQFFEEYEKLFNKLLENARIVPGAERLVKHLHKHNIPMAVATSSGRESVALKTQNHKNLFMLFNHLVSGSSDPEVKYSKPAPDIFLICASRFPQAPKPEEVLVFEDAPNGLVAAIRAGMQCVMVPDPRMPAEKTVGATQVLHSLEEFKPEDFGLPPFTEETEEETKKI